MLRSAKGITMTHERPITPAQLRAGRALLGLSQAELAGRACLALMTIKQAEAEAEAHASEAARAAIRVALEEQGVIFLSADGGEGPGVRLRRFGPPDEGLRPDQLTSDNDV
jgi:transcriptional regulator with XRE-family HTH domain